MCRGRGQEIEHWKYPRVCFSDTPLSITISTAPTTSPLIADMARQRETCCLETKAKKSCRKVVSAAVCTIWLQPRLHRTARRIRRGATGVLKTAKGTLETSCCGGGVYHLVTTAPRQNRERENAEGSNDERSVASGTRAKEEARAPEPEAHKLLTCMSG